MKFLLSTMFILITLSASAQDRFPEGCKPILINTASVILQSSKPSVILIQNHAQNDIWLTHPVSEPSASAGWNSRLQAQHWSALTLNVKSFEISCIESQPGHEQTVPCKDVIAACKWSAMQVPPKEEGTYWAAEDMLLPQLSDYLARRGFMLPESMEQN